jgi:hypothetical protein
MPLTKFAVTGRYQVHPGVSKEKYQHTTINMDGNCVGRWWQHGGIQLEIAAAALDGGGSRRICNDGIGNDVGINIVKVKGLLLWHWHYHQQGWQERTRQMQGTYIDGDGKDIGILQRQWRWRWCGCKDYAGKARARG